jgi:hypothetical protein
VAHDRGEDSSGCGAPFDYIFGSDVIFKEQYIEPLLQSIHQLSTARTQIYLCVEVRNEDLVSMFTSAASSGGFSVSKV